MIEKINGAQLEEQRKFALIGMGMFYKVSKESPASVDAQAARIAARCRQEGYSPVTIMNCLLSFRNEDLISKLGTLANRAHISSGNHIVRDGSISNRAIKDIIRSDFTQAQRMMVLAEEELEKIVSAFDNINPHLRNDERTVNGIRYELIEKKIQSKLFV